ncbi:MAG: GAF domain-containing protein, partial [Anaerolineales bacterium]
SLMQVTVAVSAGKLSQVAPVESEDEVGALARSFNSMTDQIRGLVGGLERRVEERTHDLERRAVQLRVAAEVAKEAASIRDVSGLLEHTVKLISERFGFYHAGIFIIDRAREVAVLAAASSEGGQRMLERQHQLKLGKVGIVGHVAASGEPRIALDVGKDAVFFNNPDLPDTHSEMALPMKAHGLVIGVLDVQSTQPAAFTEEDIDILQVLADQVALALENASLLQASEKSLLDLEQIYKKQVGQAWESYLHQAGLAFSYDPLGVQAGDREIEADKAERLILAPISLHGHQIGSLQLMRESGAPAWTADDQEILEVSLAQVALALESARIQEIERQRAHADQVVSRISARTQSALDVETVMKRAVEEIGKALQANKVQVVLGTNGKHASHQPGNGASG